MTDALSFDPAEALFVERAKELLPFDKAKISRGQSGALIFQWNAPCAEIGGLWLSVYADREIMMSSRISHTHIERWGIARDVNSEGEIWPNLVDQGIAEALEILNGETVFIRICDENGKEDSSGISSRCLWRNPQQRASWTASHGPGWTARAWNWFGEVTDS